MGMMDRPSRSRMKHAAEVTERPPLGRATKSSSAVDHPAYSTHSQTFREVDFRTGTPEPIPEASGMSNFKHPTSSPTSPRTARTQSPKNRSSDSLTQSFLKSARLPGTKPHDRRPRTRTLENTRERSPTLLLPRTRPRIGSVNSASSSTHRQVLEERVGSLSLASPTASPLLEPHHVVDPSRQRRLRGSPRLVTPATGYPAQDASLPSPVFTSNANRIFQLMKANRGVVRGTVGFRSKRSGSWVWGYCYINEETGSLIHSARNDAGNSILVPDLRGCQVKSSFDHERQSTCLDIVSFTHGLTVQLRIDDPEEFDNWLAALLCWLPVGSKGLQCKMTKVPSPSLGNSRRSSTASLVKDAAIIKVGKMMYWEGFGHSKFPDTPPAARSPSIYGRIGRKSGRWKKISCILQENGELKLYADLEMTLVSSVQLSQISRCAIRHLNSSILGEEFCIAIYPRYTSTSTSLSLIRPVYLALENRILFEAWFVLLRAFTIPELYGPDEITPEEDTSSVEAPTTEAMVAPQSSDLFRVERSISLCIIEAKLNHSKSIHSGGRGNFHQSDLNSIPGNYFAEIILDDEMAAKTSSKTSKENPFWREEFVFDEVPASSSCVSVILKKSPAYDPSETNGGKPSAFANEDFDFFDFPGYIGGSSTDVICGRVNVYLDEFDRKKQTEKWCSIIDHTGEMTGQMLLRVKTEELVVLMSKEYQPMSEMLHRFSNGLTQEMSRAIQPELRSLSELLVDIFQVSGQVTDWLMRLAEDEIDGIDRDSPSHRFRFSRRLGSNETFDSNVDREMMLRDLGRNATIEANLLFRGNSLFTKALDHHMRRVGKEYLEETLREKLREIETSELDCEVDPNRLDSKHTLEKNWRNLMGFTKGIWDSIANSASNCPAELRMILRHVRACAEDRFGGFQRSVLYSSVSGFLFLRFFCPAVLNPKLFGLLDEHPRPKAQRALTLIAKSLQGLANMRAFGTKETWMEPMNSFLSSHRQAFKDFIDAICFISFDPRSPSAVVPPSYVTPITIISRLPQTSREGTLSLPYLIDQSRTFASLVALWVDATVPPSSSASTFSTSSSSVTSGSTVTGTTMAAAPATGVAEDGDQSNTGSANPEETDESQQQQQQPPTPLPQPRTQPRFATPNLEAFHQICISLDQRAKDAIAKAEQVDRPDSRLSLKWEEFLGQLEDAASTPGSFQSMSRASSVPPGAIASSAGYRVASPGAVPSSTSTPGIGATSDTLNNASANYNIANLLHRFRDNRDKRSGMVVVDDDGWVLDPCALARSQSQGHAPTNTMSSPSLPPHQHPNPALPHPHAGSFSSDHYYPGSASTSGRPSQESIRDRSSSWSMSGISASTAPGAGAGASAGVGATASAQRDAIYASHGLGGSGVGGVYRSASAREAGSTTGSDISVGVGVNFSASAGAGAGAGAGLVGNGSNGPGGEATSSSAPVSSAAAKHGKFSGLVGGFRRKNRDRDRERERDRERVRDRELQHEQQQQQQQQQH